MRSFFNNKILNENKDKNNHKNIILSKEKKKSSIKSNNNSWTIQEDKLLLQLVSESEKKINWDMISQKFPGRTKSQCKYRYKKNIKFGVIKGQWSNEENQLLTEWVNKNGPKNWKKCCNVIPGRTGKQCREHWNNYLNPEIIKSNWTTEEDLIIMNFYYKFKGSWKILINAFNGRTENSIKNRFFSELRKIATSKLNSKKKSPKFRLKQLLKFLNIAISNSKQKYLNEKKFSEKDLNNFLNKMEKKIKMKKAKKITLNDTVLSTIGSHSEKYRENIKEEENSSNLIHKKRIRTEKRNLSNDLNTFEKKEKKSQEKNLFENINRISYNSINNNKTVENNSLNLLNKSDSEIKKGLNFQKNNKIFNIIKENPEYKNENSESNEQLKNYENFPNENNINNYTIKKMDFINNCQNDLFIINKKEVSQNPFFLFDNFNNKLLFPNENGLLSNFDSFSEIQKSNKNDIYISPNINPFIEKAIENDIGESIRDSLELNY